MVILSLIAMIELKKMLLNKFISAVAGAGGVMKTWY